MTNPQQKTLTIQQGADFSEDFFSVDGDGVPIDLSSGTLSMQVRTVPLGGIWATPTMTATDPTSGQFTASLTAAQTEILYLAEARYDIRFTDGSGHVTRLFEGLVRIVPDITR